jgi:hypothetical protein
LRIPQGIWLFTQVSKQGVLRDDHPSSMLVAILAGKARKEDEVTIKFLLAAIGKASFV